MVRGLRPRTRRAHRRKFSYVPRAADVRDGDDAAIPFPEETMYASILVPLDGSPLGERALVYAVPLAERHGARLILMRVHEPVLPLTVGGITLGDEASERAWRADQEHYLQKVAKRTRKRTSAVVETVFRDGKVVPTLVEFARDAQVGLIVLCTHGRGGFERLWLGSVADGLLRQLPAPTLLVRGGRSAPKLDVEAGASLFPRVVVPLDGSRGAERALEIAAGLVGAEATAFTLMSVVHPTMAMASKSFPSRAEQEMCAEYLEPLAARHRQGAHTIGVETKVSANVGRAILDAVKHHDATLVALSTQGLGGMQRLLMGSVADKLIRTAPVPVLVCPGGDA